MKKRFAVLVLVFSLILSLASTAFAYSVPSDSKVYVTPTGHCYHLRNCSYIGSEQTHMTISAAVANGYKPCSRCNPDTRVGSYGDSYAYKHPSLVIAENKEQREEAKAEAAKPQAEEKKSTSEYPWWVFFLVGIGADRVYLKLKSKEE